MSNYAVAPLADESTASLSAYALKQLVSDLDPVAVFKLFRSLGFDKVFAKPFAGTTEQEQNQFFFNVVKELESFKENAGVYINQDVHDIILSDATVAKVSVVDDGGAGGVVSYIIPKDSAKNALLLTSGGISNPAYDNGVGVSVLSQLQAFAGFGEFVYTITNLVEGKVGEIEGTNWSEGKSISVAIYQFSDGVGTKREHLVLNEHGVHRLSQGAWAEEDSDDTPAHFSYESQRLFADILESSAASVVKLGVIGLEQNDERVESTFVPVAFSGLPSIEVSADVANEFTSYVENNFPEETEELSYDVPDSEPVQNTTVEDVAEVSDNEEFNTSLGDTADETLQHAEYLVEHHEPEQFANEVTDTTAETDEPFQLGVEFLEQEVREYVEEEETSVEPLVAKNEESVAHVVDNVVSDFSDLRWDDVDTGENTVINGQPEESAEEEDPISKYASLSWDDVEQSPPVGFLQRPSS